MGRWSITLLVVVLLCIGGGVGYTAANLVHEGVHAQQSITQVSTINALLSGVYDGVFPCKELRQYGDFGIGTFDALDGEMVVLDGVVYQVRDDGRVYIVDNGTTPFATVTFFEPDYVEHVSDMNYTELKEYLDAHIPTENIFYAIKIEGSFSHVKARSVPRQEKPYPPLVEVVKRESIFELGGVNGTVVGFRCPPFVSDVNVPNYHFHFLTENRTAGGHVLDLNITQATIQVDYIHNFHMLLPAQSSGFYSTELSNARGEELRVVEENNQSVR